MSSGSSCRPEAGSREAAQPAHRAPRGLLRNAWTNIAHAPATGACNMCGWPAITVPVATHFTALPIGSPDRHLARREPHLLGLAAHPPLRPPGFSF
ncbi:hypothetical protein AB0B56_17410 [Streptosporangium canum]|uniref:hypothetical protein n=1 Tax=Streptosporangium canum TaxID=324952 RepID=UPI00343C6689